MLGRQTRQRGNQLVSVLHRSVRHASTGRRFVRRFRRESGHFPALARQLTSSAGQTRVLATVEGLLRHCALTTSTMLAGMLGVRAQYMADTKVCPTSLRQFVKERCDVYCIAVWDAGTFAG